MLMSHKDLHMASDFKKKILEIKTTTPMRHLRNRRSLCSTNISKTGDEINLDISSEMLTPHVVSSQPVSQKIEDESVNWNIKQNNYPE